MAAQTMRLTLWRHGFHCSVRYACGGFYMYRQSVSASNQEPLTMAVADDNRSDAFVSIGAAIGIIGFGALGFLYWMW